MKKLLLLFCTLMVTVGGVKAETYTMFNQTAGTFYDYFGTRSAGNMVWTAGTNTGMAGFTISLNGSNVTLDKSGNWALVVHSSAEETSYTMTLKAPEGYVIQGYELTAQIWSAYNPNSYVLTASDATSKTINSTTLQTLSVSGLNDNSTDISIVAAAASNTTQRWLAMKTLTVTMEPTFVPVNVTYNLYDSDDTSRETVLATATVVQEENSDVAVPASLTSNTFFAYATEGTIGSEDCTINVVRTVADGILYPVAFSNNATYQIYCKRGYLSTYSDNNTTRLANTVKESLGVEAKEFAVITYDDNYYLYSVSDAMFVQADGTLSTYPTDAVLTIEASGKPASWLKYGTNVVNSGSGQTTGVVINSYGTSDDGNQYVFTEAGSLSDEALAAVLATFADRTPYFEALSALITSAEAIDFGTEVGQYAKGDSFDEALAAAQTTYADADATQAALEEAAATLTEAIAACTIVSLNGKFIRLKNTAVSGYSYVGTAASGKAPLVADAANAGVYYVTADNKIVSYDQGYYLSTNAGAQCTLTGAATFTIENGGNGTYTFYYGGNGYLIAWTSGNTDRLSSVCDNARFTVEEVTDLPVTVSAAGYATLYAPVALTVPSGVAAYTGTVNGTTIELTAVEGTIPAGTPVLLAAEAGTYTFSIADDVESIDAGALVGTTGPIAAPDGSYVLQNHDGTVAFYTVDTEVAQPNVLAFRAYIPAGDSDVKAYTIGSLTTAVATVRTAEAAGQSPVFNLAGQRVSRLHRGVNIVRGMKVVVK